MKYFKRKDGIELTGHLIPEPEEVAALDHHQWLISDCEDRLKQLRKDRKNYLRYVSRDLLLFKVGDIIDKNGSYYQINAIMISKRWFPVGDDEDELTYVVEYKGIPVRKSDLVRKKNAYSKRIQHTNNTKLVQR